MINPTLEKPIFVKIAQKIIEEQALIIGPLAWDEAKKVSGLNVLEQNQSGTKSVVITSENPGDVINHLVARYEQLFGKLSHEICKEATEDLVDDLPKEDIPTSLA